MSRRKRNKIKIIYQPYGGLGDNLQFSTLPELFSKQGYDVYLHLNNAVRNKEIEDLVWNKNPFIKGKINGIANIGPHIWEKSSIKQIPENSFIETMELRHGLEKTNKYPKIYYEPDILENLKNKTILDINCISDINKFKKEDIIFTIKNLINNLKIDKENILVLSFKNLNDSDTNKLLDDYKKLIINDIYQLCDTIKSCKNFICRFSGSHVLASSIKRENEYPKIKCLASWWPMEHWHNFGFPNVDYIKINKKFD